MDGGLAKEVADILEIEDEDAQRKGITKIMFYLLTLPAPPKAYYPVIERFIQRAFEMLPSSSLPQQLARKLGVSKHRRRVVSFSSPTFCTLASLESLSSEGQLQKTRESGSLSITNTDPSRRFSPKGCFTEGLDIQTKHISLLPCDLSNTFQPQLQASSRRGAKPSVSLSQVLQDASVLEAYN